MQHEILLVKIHRALKEGKSLYSATQGNWKVNKRRLEHIKWVVGIDKSEVASVYEVQQWSIVDNHQEAGRVFFTGKEASSEMSKIIEENKHFLLKKFGQGSAIAYAYINDLNH